MMLIVMKWILGRLAMRGNQGLIRTGVMYQSTASLLNALQRTHTDRWRKDNHSHHHPSGNFLMPSPGPVTVCGTAARELAARKAVG